MNLKTLLRNLIASAIRRLLKSTSKARAAVVKASRDQKRHQLMFYPTKATKSQKKIFFGSFRLHYNWCSSHVVPVQPGRPYDPSWDVDGDDHLRDMNAFDYGGDDGDNHTQTSELAVYLEWLEDKVRGSSSRSSTAGDCNNNGTSCSDDRYADIDRLAELFISNCHEKFRLEKVESYRRFQEMLARGL